MKKLYSLIGSILGFVVIVLYALRNAQALFGITFEGSEDLLGYFNVFQQYLVYALAGLAGLEFVAGKKIIRFVFFLLLAFVVITTFFPDVVNGIM